MEATETPDLANECFVISPIGKDDSPERARANKVLRHVIKPAVEALDLVPVRADQVAKPGQITLQVIEHVLGAKAAVADLTSANPNVYYELAIRHTAHLPIVLIAEEGETLPFDIANMRTIFFDHQDLDSASEAKTKITAQMQEALGGALDSPVAASVNLSLLERGDAVERTLAELVEAVEALTHNMVRNNKRIDKLVSPRRLVKRSPKAVSAPLTAEDLRAVRTVPVSSLSEEDWDRITERLAAIGLSDDESATNASVDQEQNDPDEETDTGGEGDG